MEQVSQIQLLYELAMSIGTSLDMKKMLQHSLQVYLKKLGCLSGAVIRSCENEKQSIIAETVFSIPRRFNSPQIIDSSLKVVTEKTNNPISFAELSNHLPLVWNNQNNYFHLLELTEFGFLYLAKSNKPLSSQMIKSLRPLNDKLAYSCRACLQNTKIENLVEERTGQLSEVNEELHAEIAERIRTEEELKKAKQLADEASTAKSDFLANMSHEIRTPLNGILGIAEMMGDLRMVDTQRNLLNIMAGEAESVLSIINDILDFSKIEVGRIELEETPFDLRKILDDLAASLAIKAEQKSLPLITFIPPELDTRRVGDPVRIRQIMVNLISNAVKFTHKGEVFATIDSPPGSDKEDLIRFRIMDSGIGIPEEKQEAIFESFTQADGSTTRKYGGTGLGTAISRKLVELMGGQIGLESIAGSGSTFWFTLRLAKQDNTRLIKKNAQTTGGLKILVLEDNWRSGFVIESYLKFMGSIPIIVSDPNQAAIKEKPEHFDLVLVDQEIAQSEQFQIEHFYHADQGDGTPCILMSSSEQKTVDNPQMKKNLFGHLIKPIKKGDLERIIRLVGEQRKENIHEGIQPRLQHNGSGFTPKKPHDIKILVAEDYPTNQKVAISHLEKAGYKVDLVENGLEAFEAFTANDYDCILMDIQMPEMDGYEATLKIRLYEKNMGSRAHNKKLSTRVPIIAMTAHAFKECREECHAVGMDDFITKPLRRKDLLELVESYTTKKIPPIPAHSRQQMEAPDSIKANIEGKEPIDLTAALSEFLGDSELLNEVLAEFMLVCEKQIQAIQEAIDNQVIETICREAHSIKGGAANLLANGLAEEASNLEAAGRIGDIQAASIIMKKVVAEFATLKKYLNATELPAT